MIYEVRFTRIVCVNHLIIGTNFVINKNLLSPLTPVSMGRAKRS